MYEKVKTFPKQFPYLVTSLPSTADDGDQVVLVDSLTAPTYSWLLQYVAAKSSNKWVFVGGSPVLQSVATDEGTASASYVALTTAGPSFTVPVAGDYIIEIGAQTYNDWAAMSFDVGGTGAADADATACVATTNFSTHSHASKKTGVAASTALVSKYKKLGSGTAQFKNRWMTVVPVALGG